MTTKSIALPLALLLNLLLHSPVAVDTGNPYAVPPPLLPQPQWHQPHQQQQYPKYPNYRVPVAVPNPPAAGQGCYGYASPWCPPLMTTVEGECRESPHTKLVN